MKVILTFLGLKSYLTVQSSKFENDRIIITSSNKKELTVLDRRTDGPTVFIEKLLFEKGTKIYRRK